MPWQEYVPSTVSGKGGAFSDTEPISEDAKMVVRTCRIVDLRDTDTAGGVFLKLTGLGMGTSSSV